jgi:hypothetical protein
MALVISIAPQRLVVIIMQTDSNQDWSINFINLLISTAGIKDSKIKTMYPGFNLNFNR